MNCDCLNNLGSVLAGARTWRFGPRTLLLSLSLFAVATAASADTCPPGPGDPVVTVCSPTLNQLVPTPTHVLASTTDSQHKVVAVQIYVDNALIYQVDSDAVDTYIDLSLGKHLVTVQAWDDSGATFKTNVNVSMQPACALSAQNQSVTICTPGDGAVVSLPVHLNAGITDSTPLQSIEVFADGTSTYQTSSPPLDVYLTGLKTGKHALMVTAKDQDGASFSNTISITVASKNGITNLRHIIFFVQENRSFDNYFGMLGAYRVSKGLPNSIDGIPLDVTLYDKKGHPIHPFHFQTVCHENLSPFWNESHTDLNGGKMDGYMVTALPSQIDPTGTRAMGYYDQTDLPYYYELATQFATSDRFFSPVMTNTIGNRMYLFAATSFGHIRPDTPPEGGWPQKTIFDRLDQGGVSWRYYYQDDGIYLPEWRVYQQDADKLYPISSWYTDIQNEATLPSVIFIERGGPSGLDEHPGNNIQIGAATVKEILDALLASQSWASSAFILTYDEAGALYDHVLPATLMPPDNIPPRLHKIDQPGDFGHSGFRIPVTVVSPWVKPNYVSHTWRDLTSILRLIETRFNLKPLTARDATADNMLEFFDFTNPYWLTPPPLPDQPTDGVCDFNLEKAPRP
jgi:phospholipase C